MENPSDTRTKITEKITSSLDGAHSTMLNELSWLHDVITGLETRLEPVKTSLPGDDRPPLEAHGASNAVSQVDNFIASVVNARARLTHIIDELEV